LSADEAFRIAFVGLAENLLTLMDNLLGRVVVQNLWREQADAAVMVFDVVPGKEGCASGSRTRTASTSHGSSGVTMTCPASSTVTLSPPN
jgi:hypothetical protein